MDLLTVVTHELGHILGLTDVSASLLPNDLMDTDLPTGTRRLPSPADMNALAIGQFILRQRPRPRRHRSLRLAAVPSHVTWFRGLRPTRQCPTIRLTGIDQGLVQIGNSASGTTDDESDESASSDSVSAQDGFFNQLG